MRTTLLVAAVASSLAAGCAHQKDVKQESAAAHASSSSSAAPPTSTITAHSDDDHQRAAGECDSGAARVHFAFNSDDLSKEDRDRLAASARCLRLMKGEQLALEGNADERGTEEYNLALGERRARVVERYLESLGVDGVRLKTVSYGKGNPICESHDEVCWSQNRRVDLKLPSTRR